MGKNISEYIELCQWDSAKFLIFSENVFGNLIYYTHLLPLFISLILAIFVFSKNRNLLATRHFLITSILLSAWLFFDLILWATEKPSYTMFFWSLVNMIEPIIYAGILFFMYSFIDGKDLSFKKKLVIFVLLLPTVILTSTRLNLATYDLTNCWRESIEGPLPYYSYLVEVILTLWILILGMERFIKYKERSEKIRVLLVTIGAVFFLLSFAMGNVIGSLLVDWEIGQYGLFGIPVFVAMLTYLIVKYSAFNIRVIGAQILVIALWILTLAILFLREIESVRIIVSVTLILFTVLGFNLIKSVRKEVEQREKIEKLAEELRVANDRLRELDKQKSEFLSFASHQLRSPLTAIKGYASLVLEGTFGAMSDSIKNAVDKIFQSAQGMVLMVEDFLNISRIEQGRMKYEMTDLDIAKLAEEISGEMKPVAEQKNLVVEFEARDKNLVAEADPGKLRQVIANLIDNSIKYTPSGKVSVSALKNGNAARIVVADTGVGIAKSEISKLFEKFSRTKNANEVNVTGTGLGLYLAKMIVEAHHGKIWAESEGEGKGSQFVVELPLK